MSVQPPFSPVAFSRSQLAETIFRFAVAAVQPQPLIERHVSLHKGQLQIAGKTISVHAIPNLYVIGAGKATAPMAQAVEQIIGEHITDGLILVKYGHALPLQRIRTMEAAHPVPDESGLAGTRQLLQLLGNPGENDVVLVLLSGGGSALLTDVPPGCSLADLQTTIDLLLKSGADIREVNTVRKHLSQVKGGQLAKAAHPATVITLILSDVLGDQLDVIASGPTVADPTTFSDAWQIAEKYALTEKLPASIQTHLQAGLRGEVAETPKPGDAIFTYASNQIIGSNAIALEAARQYAESIGFYAKVVNNSVQGEVREVARQFVQRAKEIAANVSVPKPALLLMGGETTVTVRGKGLGGRNQEFALAAALELSPGDPIVILSGGTDGTDGPTDAAGAIVDGHTVTEAAQQGLVATDFLQRNDSYHFFRQAGGHLVTKPTLTNVMDVILALVD